MVVDLKEAFRTRRAKIGFIVAIVIFILLIVAVYLSFFSGKHCSDYECFKKEMASCSKAAYQNEMPEATWGYSITGTSGNECVIRVKLLQAKQGTLGIDALEGYSMDCYYPLGVSAYPESDLSKCHGRLKEELQSIVINKLYSYIVDNIGQVSQSIKNAI